MDWTGVPDSVQSRLSIGVWNDIFEDNAAAASATLPNNDTVEKTNDLIAVWQSTDSAVKPTITTFTQLNIVSSVAALITALPLRQRITPSLHPGLDSRRPLHPRLRSNQQRRRPQGQSRSRLSLDLTYDHHRTS
jgi:hypothetical protein